MTAADLILATLARELRWTRRAQEVTQQAVADSADLSLCSVQNAEQGQAMTLATLVGVAAGVNCRLEVRLIPLTENTNGRHERNSAPAIGPVSSACHTLTLPRMAAAICVAARREGNPSEGVDYGAVVDCGIRPTIGTARRHRR